MTNQSDYYGKYLQPGTYVRRGSLSFDADGEIPAEYGVVVYCWGSSEIDTYDCYVAFYGYSMPDKTEELENVPYVLRYASTSLTVVDKHGEPID